MPLAEFADRLNSLLPVVMREFTRRQAYELGDLYKGKITFAQLMILELLFRQGESRMTFLAQAMSVTTAAMTGLIARLVRYSYAVRVYDPKDRRIVKVKLTPKGIDAVKKISQIRRNMIANTFGQITQREREEYLRIITRVHEILLLEKNGAGA